MLHQNQRVVDNPVYLCDLGASLSAADPAELQAILEEMDVSSCFIQVSIFLFYFLSNLLFCFLDFKTFITLIITFKKRIRTI